jgi:hypothetical protein
MTGSAFSLPSEEASSPKKDMSDTDGMLKRSKGNSLRNLFAKSSALRELQDDGIDGRKETKDRHSNSETVTTDTKDRTKHHKRVGSFDQLLGRESGGGSRSNDKGLRPEGRRSRSGDNLDRMSNTLRPEGRKTRSGDNLDRMRNSLPSEGQKPPSRREGRRSRSGEHLERKINSLRPEGHKTRSGDNLDRMKFSLGSEGQKPPSRPKERRSRSGEHLDQMSSSLPPKGRKTRSGDNLERMRNSLPSEGQKPSSLRNIFGKSQKKEGPTDSLKLAQMIMAEFANFEDWKDRQRAFNVLCLQYYFQSLRASSHAKRATRVFTFYARKVTQT